MLLCLQGIIRGAVQGVGFRPYVYRLARELALTGWVQNTPQGVRIEAEGTREELDRFVLRLHQELPPRACIQSSEFSFRDPSGFSGFVIRPSDSAGTKTALVMPDLALCDDCLRELFDPSDRRHRYPFITCTNCGPRYSIITGLPYDRANTTMRLFAMCPACLAEYGDPSDRRFHAQPNACPVCGPHLECRSPEGASLSRRDDALRGAVDALRAGQIVAVKGIGGFHLMTAASNDDAVRRLRHRKHREEKPFALMVPSIAEARQLCDVDGLEERLLRSPEAPIVLLRRKGHASAKIADSVAPGNPSLALMLPYAPLHHLLLRDAGFPLVATSGNLQDEPLCTDEDEARRRLGEIADLFLVHNRPIARHVDDSIVRRMLGREMVLRRARGYAPLPVMLPSPVADTLAVGAHLKNTVALTRGSSVFLSQHIGDLATPLAFTAFTTAAEDLQQLFEGKPTAVVSDLHPDYLSSGYARSRPEHQVTVQHHIAHVAGCMAENGLEGSVLGVAWDGTGLGTDGTIWGGEFIVAEHGDFRRVASLRPFRLPGGEKAVREPRRSALGVLFELMGPAMRERTDLAPLREWTEEERAVLIRMLAQRIHAPVTSSAGRLFDAAASLLGIRQCSTFEGQAAMELEFASGDAAEEPYPFAVNTENDPVIVDWGPAMQAMIAGQLGGVSRASLASRFHATLAAMILAVARSIGLERVVLSGGCFQNAVLTARSVRALEKEGFRPYWHQRVPPNDGGIALGQIAAAFFTGRIRREE